MSSSAPDLSAVPRHDQIFLGGGILAFIFSFISFAHVTVSGLGSGGSITAWHGVGSLAGVVLILALGVGAAIVFAPSSLPNLPVSPRLLATGLAALAFIFFVIRWLTLPKNILGTDIDFSLSWGGYVLLVLNIIMIVGGYLGMKANGESLPGQSSAPPAAPPI